MCCRDLLGRKINFGRDGILYPPHRAGLRDYPPRNNSRGIAPGIFSLAKAITFARITILDAMAYFNHVTVRKREIIRQLEMDNAMFESRFLHGDGRNSRRIAVRVAIVHFEMSISVGQVNLGWARWTHKTKSQYFGREPGLQPPHRRKTRYYPPRRGSDKWTMQCSGRDSCTVTTSTVAESLFVSPLSILGFWNFTNYPGPSQFQKLLRFSDFLFVKNIFVARLSASAICRNLSRDIIRQRDPTSPFARFK